MRLIHGNNYQFAVFACLFSSLCATALLYKFLGVRNWSELQYQPTAVKKETPNINLGLNESWILRYPQPHNSIKEQVLPNVRYFIHPGYGGHTNQIISIIRGAYYAKLTERVYIVPTLFGSHFDGQPVPLSTFYNVERFMQSSNIPMVELARIKPLSDSTPEMLPCWSVHNSITAIGANPPSPLNDHNINLQYWALPDLQRSGDRILFSEIVNLDYEYLEQTKWIQKVKDEFIPQKDPPTSTVPAENMKWGFDLSAPSPDWQLFCLDTTLFLHAFHFTPQAHDPLQEPEITEENDQWLEVGQHLHFNDQVDRVVSQILQKLLGDANKPFMAVHVRRGDFAKLDLSFTIDPYVKKLEKVIKETQRRLDHPNAWTAPGKHNFKNYGIKASDYPVIITTDEEAGAPLFEKIRNHGWILVNHTELGTVEAFENWGPTILDAAILSKASGFVGTFWSTFSFWARLRVKYWQGGYTELVSKDDIK